MRLWGWVIVFGVVAAGAGCTQSRTAADHSAARLFTPAMASDGLFVQSVLLERPVGDAFLDREIWTMTLPAGEPETRARMAENGLRAGVLTGRLPQQLQDLLESETETVDPHALTFHHRQDAVFPTAGPVDPCKFSLLADLSGKPRAIELKQARCGILVRPQPVDGRRVNLACEPQIQHGERREGYRPTEDGTKFTKFVEIPLEKYPELGFEATLGPDDCLLIGWSADRPETLGAVLFGVEANNHPRQRVLVIRAHQMGRTPAADLPPIVGPLRRR